MMTHWNMNLVMAFLCGISAWLPCLPGIQSTGLRKLKPGQAFPAFRLDTENGKTLSNLDLEDKPAVILYLSPGQRGSEWAAREAHRILDRFKGKVKIIYATADIGKSGYFHSLWKRFGITEPIGLDRTRALYGKLGLIVFPTTMILDKEGRLTHVITERGANYIKALDSYLRFETGEWTKEHLIEVLKARDPLLRTPKSMASRYRVSARLLRRKGLLASAEKELRKAMALSPKEPEIQLDLAEILLKQKKTDDALATIQALRKQCPEHKRARITHGIILYKRKDLGKAKELLLQSLLLNPEPSAVHYYLGRIYETEGNKDKALEHYRKAARGLLRDY